MKYWAFLSYSHADEAAATKLHKALENYTLPAMVRKAHGLPKRLIPVFRDVEELEAAAGLTQRLENALDESRWLVVLCSPAAEKSKYVNAEIEYFLGKHGPDKILCVLAEGNPPDCFPPAIRALKDEPLAADLRAGADIDLAILKLISAMAVIGLTELRNRELQRTRRTRIAAAAAFATLSFGGLTYWDLFHREHVDYYVNYTRRNGVWEGVDRVSFDVATHRAASYRFTRRGRLHPPDRVDYYKGCGTFEKTGMPDVLGRIVDIDQDGHAYCAASFKYRSDGSIAQETLLNKLGLARESLTYTEDGLAQFTEQGFAAASSRSGIYYVQFTRDSAGLDASVRFLQSRGVPRANDQHEFGYAFSYDGEGRLIRKSVLDDHGAEIGEVTQYRYQPHGYLAEENYLDQNNRPRLSSDGYAAIQYQRDEYGNWIEEKFIDANGRPTLDSTGVAAHQSQWDSNGNQIEIRHLDAQGHLALNVEGVAAIRMTFDSNGFRVRTDFFDTKLEPTEQEEGAASYTFENDAFGNNVENKVFDVHGAPAVWNNGVWLTRKKFNERGQELEEAFFGPDGKPVVTTWGAMHASRYDDRGNIIEFAFFDAAGKRYVRPDRGWAVFRVARDEKGNRTEGSFLDQDLKPTSTKSGGLGDGAAFVTFVHDDHGNETEVHYLDTARHPVQTHQGVAAYNSRFDRAGNEIERRYFAVDNRPARHRDFGFGWNAEYDRRGRITRQTFVDASGQPAAVTGGYASLSRVYDAFGNVVGETYFDAIGKPLTSHGSARLAIRYDRYSRETDRRYFDANNAPVAGPQAFAALTTERDIYGRVTLERCVNAFGKPVDRADEGWATHKVSYTGGKKVDVYLNAGGREVVPNR